MVRGRFPAVERSIPCGTEIPATRIDVEKVHQREVADVADALGLTRAVTRRRQRGQKHSGQDRDDRDHDQEFHQREAPPHRHRGTVMASGDEPVGMSHISSLRSGHKCRTPVRRWKLGKAGIRLADAPVRSRLPGSSWFAHDSPGPFRGRITANTIHPECAKSKRRIESEKTGIPGNPRIKNGFRAGNSFRSSEAGRSDRR